MQDRVIDYLFAGAGASSTLLLMSMEQRGLLNDKNIAILDPDSKSLNDKTYCFWENPNEPLPRQCQHLVSHKWGNVSVNQQAPESLSPLYYFHLSGIDLYRETQRIIEAYNIQRLHTPVLALETTLDGVKVQTDKEDWYARTVFDSRPPKFLPPKKNEAHLLQSFIGFVIKIDKPISNADCVDLMDFDVEQQGWTQFVYILPFDVDLLLVELTRFGHAPITHAEGEPILDQYISRRFGSYKIVDTETGCIPMSSAPIINQPMSNVINIGGNAGAVKPSTGYAFKNMFRHAEDIADCLQKGLQPKKKASHWRFSFYDRLLLFILRNYPNQGKRIFQTLFQKNNVVLVLHFLDERTNLSQDLRIFATLPFKPFLQAWWFDVTIRYRSLMVPLCLLLLSFGLLLLFHISPLVFNWVELIAFLAGLFFVGIPHGAVDHLLAKGEMESRPSIRFVIRYLGAAMVYFIGWLIFPLTALLFFLLYSIWHFGQNDMNEWQPRTKNPVSYLVWGLILFSVILCSHISETNAILSNLRIPSMPLSDQQGTLASLVLLIYAYTWGFWKRYPAMIITSGILTVGIQLPLLTVFGLYFIGQHSVNGWKHLKQGLGTNTSSLFLKALPFTIAAFLLFGFLLYAIEIGLLHEFKDNWLTAFFVFVSCISFPHVIAMHQFYKKFH
jgi:lycopene beta-cyclase